MTTAPTGSIFSTQSLRIQEIINKGIDVLLPSLDPAWRDSIVSSQGVIPASAIGRDMKMIKVYMAGLTGVFESAASRDDFVLYGDDALGGTGFPAAAAGIPANLFLQGISQTFPSPLEGPNQAPFRLGIGMRAMVGSIMLTLGELQAEALPALIGEIIAPKMEGFARKIAHTLCNYWYLSQNSYYALATMGTATTAGSGTNYTIKFNPQNLATNRFAVGQRVDIFDTTGATRRNTNGGARIWLYVLKVDKLRNEVTLTTTAGGAVPTAPSGWSLASTDIVVLANSKGSANTPYASSPYFTGIAGINSWLKTGSGSDDNYLLGGERDTSNYIDVTAYPQFKSMSYSLGGNALTEHTLRKIFRRWNVAKADEGYDIDYVVASDGVWLAYEATKIGQYRLDRTDRVSSLKNEGSSNSMKDEVTYHYDGRTYTFATSAFVESGTVYAYKRGGNNWKRMIPPSPKGVSRFDRSESFAPFEFVASALTGLATNQVPIFQTVNNQNLLTEAVQMPGMLRMQLVPDQPCGIKLTNVAEDRLYSDN